MGTPLKTGEVNYDVSITPEPLVVKTALSTVNENGEESIQLSVTDIPGLNISLKPIYDWNPVNDLLTLIGTVANTMSSSASSAIVTLAKGYQKSIVAIKPIPIDKDGINLTVTPSNVVLENFNGYLMVGGDVAIS